MARKTNDAGGAQHGMPYRRRAGLVLTGLAVLTALLLIGLGAALSGLVTTSPPPSGPRTGDRGDSDVAPMRTDERELVTRPMPAVPAQAALPHALADTSAGPAIDLAAPGIVTGRSVPGGFPRTAEGGLAQLVALTRSGVAGGDPDTYAAAYTATSAPGAPPAASSYVHRQLADLRASGGLRPTGPVPGLTITWTPTSGLVKGTTIDGSLVVVCVLGQLDVDYRGRVASAGLGDCQALRRIGDEWRIAAGPSAATAPSAWPGSSEAVAAGYRELR